MQSNVFTEESFVCKEADRLLMHCGLVEELLNAEQDKIVRHFMGTICVRFHSGLPLEETFEKHAELLFNTLPNRKPAEKA